jgi:hypothetical protein
MSRRLGASEGPRERRPTRGDVKARHGQTVRPARPRPDEAQPVLAPARQARLENRVGSSKPTGSISYPSPARSGPLAEKKWADKRAKRAGKHVLVQKSGLNGLRGKRVVPG